MLGLKRFSPATNWPGWGRSLGVYGGGGFTTNEVDHVRFRSWGSLVGVYVRTFVSGCCVRSPLDIEWCLARVFYVLVVLITAKIVHMIHPSKY